MNIYARRIIPLLAASCTCSSNFLVTTFHSSEPLFPRRTKKVKYVIVGIAGAACLSQLVTADSNTEKDVFIIDANPLHSLQHIESTSLPIVDFNIESQTIELSSGETIEFDKCLLAMGKPTTQIRPSALSSDISSDQIMYIQANSSHAQLAFLKQQVLKHRHVTVLGGAWQSLAIAR